jgi:carbonic anhydrase
MRHTNNYPIAAGWKTGGEMQLGMGHYDQLYEYDDEYEFGDWLLADSLEYEGHVTKVPTPGSFYEPQFVGKGGKGGLLETAGKAYKLRPGVERLSAAQEINNHCLNRKFWRKPGNDFEGRNFPEGIIEFSPSFTNDKDQCRAKPGQKRHFARIWIPPLLLTNPKNPTEALSRLKQGNELYAKGTPSHQNQTLGRRAAVAPKQNPWAIVWGCIDSRVPPEIIFDQGLGDLFVVRTAGQAADAISEASVQFGIEEYKVPLVVVLGHTNCGAVKATCEAYPETKNNAIINKIKPAIEGYGNKAIPKREYKKCIEKSVKKNVSIQVGDLTNRFKADINAGRLGLVGALYDLKSGRVQFLR